MIANTCWRNPPRKRNSHGGGFWHIDAGPHIPHAADVSWDDRIPFPVFAIGAHIYLQDCPLTGVALFVSDVWHRRLPSREGDAGRYFLQVHYGRRDIAQRILPTSEVNHVTALARDRIASERERRLLGLHPNFFYDG